MKLFRSPLLAVLLSYSIFINNKIDAFSISENQKFWASNIAGITVGVGVAYGMFQHLEKQDHEQLSPETFNPSDAETTEKVLNHFWGSHGDSCARKKINAGILPYCYDEDGNAFFLLGQEFDGPWADFGGRAEEGEDSQATALREFSEETKLVYGKFAKEQTNLEKEVDFEEFLNASRNYIKSRLTGMVAHPKGYYVMYLAHVDFIRASSFERAYKTPHYEKKGYAWVPVEDFMNAMKESPDRWKSFYQDKQIRRQFVDILKSKNKEISRIVLTTKQ